jgi:hypothetical protein
VIWGVTGERRRSWRVAASYETGPYLIGDAPATTTPLWCQLFAVGVTNADIVAVASANPAIAAAMRRVFDDFMMLILPSAS